MIVSHKYKFIFIKTRKTAGTSLEVALSKYCGNDDIITPHGSEYLRKKYGFTTARNYKKSLKDMSFIELLTSIRKRKPCKKYYHHMSASEISYCVGERIWNSYFKFTIVRNPFDKLVSQYYYRKRERKSNDTVSFDTYLIRHQHIITDNWNLYTENNKVIVDDFVRYENLEADLKRISDRLSLPENVYDVMKYFNEKGNIRDKNKSYREILSEESKNLIYTLARDEINLFGYKY